MSNKQAAAHVSAMIMAGFACIASIASVEAISKINGSQIAFNQITNAHIKADAAIAASKLDANLATKSYVNSAVQGNPAGTIIMVGGSTPSGYLLCDGAAYDGTSATYAALWAAIGNTFGGTVQSAFNVPDFRGRVPIGAGQGSGLSSRLLGAFGGSETHALSIAEMPSHTHDTKITLQNQGYSGGNVIYSADAGNTTGKVTAAAGSGQAHPNMQPWLCVRYCIKL